MNRLPMIIPMTTTGRAQQRYDHRLRDPGARRGIAASSHKIRLVVDANGVVYANSEDGNLYAINQGGTLKSSIFLDLTLGAAYTPLAIGPDGRVYTEN